MIEPHKTRRRIADKFMQSARLKARALAMLKTKQVEQPRKKHDNLPV